MAFKSVKEKIETTFDILKDKFGYKNRMESPKLIKVVVGVGVGSVNDKNKLGIIEDRLQKITGQKPAKRGAKKSIAAFKTREGDVVGYQITLRGKMMYSFMDKLINISLPRTKDFRGIPLKTIDNMGNCTIGIKEHTIFPETSDEDIKDVFGLAVTINTTAKNKEEAEEFLKNIGIPFQKANN